MIDNIPDGTGAFSSIIDGGMNLNHTIVLMKSQPGGKINCKVTIFSYRNPVMPVQQPQVGWKSPPQPNQPNHIPNAPSQQPPQQRPYNPWPTLQKKK